MSFDLSSLNPEQRAAVTHPGGPLLVLAGAGSGKTRVIAARIAHLVRAQGVAPGRILAVTFTNKAAREMAERVTAMLPAPPRTSAAHAAGQEGGRSARPTVCTFHSFCVRLLREHISALGYRPQFVIFDSQDQLQVLRTLMEEGDYDTALLPPKNAVFAISQAKGRGVTAEELLNHGGAPADLLLGRLLQGYQQALQRMNALDFEDLLNLGLRLLQEHPQRAQDYFSRFDQVLVDEYQDTNRAQYLLLRGLVARHGNLCVVGDDDQSIYHWRGAEPGNILDFERDFPGARVVRLQRNYRSSDAILAAANQVIRNNVRRKDKVLEGTQGPGQPLQWLLGQDERDELEMVTTHLRLACQREGGRYSDVAILYRANHQSRLIEEVLRDAGVPYRLVGGTRFYERKEVKDALAYLRLMVNPADEVSLYRVLNFPRRGIGQASQLKLAEHAALKGQPALGLMASAAHYPDFTGPVATAMERFAALVGRYSQRFAGEPMGAVFRDLVAELDLVSAAEKEKADPKSREKAGGLILELALGVDQFAREHAGAGLKDFLEHVALFTQQEDAEPGQGPPQVALMTVHAAKGLEFPTVYVVNLADDLFPNRRALLEGALEEERRLFYVAITRARSRLVLSMARVRRRYGEAVTQHPSPFVLEIEPGLFAGEAPQAPGSAPRADAAQQRALRAQQAKARFFDQLKSDSRGGERLPSSGTGTEGP
ncbi:MAG TPA: UvrD-helicase domain-containing protein [bacterium]|nr:UvrD-helicase domain-containing protein [bacterium]